MTIWTKLLLLSFTISQYSYAVEVPIDIHEKDHIWTNFHIYNGNNQRGGPFKFDDQYLEIEFGGRSGLWDLYGYVDFKDIFSQDSSDVHDGSNMFADIEPRMSLDYLFGKDLSIGPIKEWYLAFDLYYGDNECAQTCVTFDDSGEALPGEKSSGLKILWWGIGTDTELPWLGKTGINFYARFIRENYGASNEDSLDGYVIHINWFKPIYTLSNNGYIAFQGYMDYEFASDMPESGNEFEQEYRTDDSFQSYLGLWYHSGHLKVGLGLKLYHDMTQWKDGAILSGKEVDSTGVGQYINIGYAF